MMSRPLTRKGTLFFKCYDKPSAILSIVLKDFFLFASLGRILEEAAGVTSILNITFPVSAALFISA